jgi:hypothetical protein
MKKYQRIIIQFFKQKFDEIQGIVLISILSILFCAIAALFCYTIGLITYYSFKASAFVNFIMNSPSIVHKPYIWQMFFVGLIDVITAVILTIAVLAILQFVLWLKKNWNDATKEIEHRMKIESNIKDINRKIEKL